MAVEAVVSVVIQNVTYLLIQESIFFSKAIDQVEDIRIELRRMRGFLTDAEERQDTNNEVKKWVGGYLEILYKVEEIVESYVLRLVHKKTGMGLLKNYGFYFHDWAACHNLRRKMKHIEGKIRKLEPPGVENASFKSISYRQYSASQVDISHNSSSFSQTKRTFSGAYEEDDLDFVGFKDDEKLLEKRLTSKHGKIIRVVGPLGSGKTTLVKRLYNCKSIKEQFSAHVWLNVSEEHVYKDLLLRVWNQVNKNRDTELTVLDEGQLEHNLKEFLHDKKYLIVLDDARKQPDAWTKLIEILPDISGCKVVLVTRQDDIAISQGTEGQPLYPQPLNEEESREFLKRLCPQKGSDLFSGQTSLWNQILRKCQGLPLNIVLLGGFLSTKKMSCEELTRLCSQPNWISMDLWLLSYTDLPAHYKLCLLYLTLFPKEFDLSVRRILRLWLAEGFIQRPPQMGEESEDLAEECFNDLVKRNLVKVSKFRSDGGPRKCHLPGFLREHLSPKAQEISLYHIHHLYAEQRPQQPPGRSMEQSIPPKVGVRRIVEYADIKDYVCDSNVQNLRSYLSFNFQRYDTPAKGVGNFLRKLIGNKGFGLLRVLDLEGVYKPILPKTLKHLLMLRYLGLRWTFLDSLPKSVGDLPYLETLDLKGTYINTLPSSVWKLKHLRHLNLPHVRLDMSMQQPSSKLVTLWGLIIDDDCHIKKGLNQYYDLRELGISCQLKDFDNLLEWITGLTHLQSLSLTSKDEKGRPSNLAFREKQTLSELHKLSRLKLLGKLSNLLKKDQFPPNLRVLTLSVSNLEDDPMGVLSQLQCLSVLRLLAKSYNGNKMQCPENGFRNLLVLKLWMLDNLQELIVKQGGMPRIRELNIRFCQSLKELPNELLQRNTLKELILTSMPDEFEKNVRENKCKHTSLQSNSFEFTPLPWEKEPELWG